MGGLWWGLGERVFERVFEGFCGLGVFERVLWLVCLGGVGVGFVGVVEGGVALGLIRRVGR